MIWTREIKKSKSSKRKLKKDKELLEIQLKFQAFITENQKLRLKEKIISDGLKMDLKKSNTKILELENKINNI